ncbi:hypothetical protein CspeluHIS016_0802000 [Cutaneotrichosporon spelunceum]|uniref:Uncharacterized protein n=1 Tax=Cutaneotrichosporon spelunceum TaxID=1672016 RepID=A0AAD3TZ81_9TREE|nr:hypothetical protein CspeluHIS016_0802000 [Cutaneotrichosporon spelunceum]
MAHLSRRPVYHFIAPRGWMNDPCAPGYDPLTGRFHLFYQWTPHSHRWERIAWGHATSKDLLHWAHDSQDMPALKADTEYDKEGVFTGCFWPTGPKGEDALTVFYTNVWEAPHFTKPYTRGCEGLALATSADGGKTWNKHPCNPIIAEEPEGLNVTGFRDPYLGPWPAMDRARGTSGRLYGLNSGGIHGQGPRTFLYDVDPTDLTRWTYLYPLFRSHSARSRPGGKWGGDLGLNLECTNFVTLSAGDVEREVIITGSEGGAPRPRGGEPRYGVWVLGSLEGEEVDLDISAAGMVDWGALYAFNTFLHQGRRILWGWLIEEDLSDGILAERGWTGCLGVPRELFLASYSGVTGTLKSKVADVGSFEVLPSGEVVTLGMRPLPELVHLRGSHISQAISLGGSHFRCEAARACTIDLVVEVTDGTEEVALHVRQSADGSTRTSISFFPKEEVIKVCREHSNDRADIVKTTEEGPFTLLRFSELERLRMTVLLDGDVLEVFANDRFALSTRIYSPAEATGVAYEHKGLARVEHLDVWEMKAAQ